MRYSFLALAISICLILTACKKDDPASSSDQYVNKLTLGTGMNASNFTLVGEGSSFTRGASYALIYYRLESVNDYGGAGISIKIEKQSGSNYTTVGTYSYPNPQSYGHIIMSSFTVTDVGSFRATGLLTNTSNVIATANFTVQ